MKNKSIISAVLFFFMTILGTQVMAQKSGEASIKLMTDITCQSCKSKIEKNIGYEKGVVAVDADIESDVVTVTYKSSKTTPETISAALTKLGYDNQPEGTSEGNTIKHSHKSCDK